MTGAGTIRLPRQAHGWDRPVAPLSTAIALGATDVRDIYEERGGRSEALLMRTNPGGRAAPRPMRTVPAGDGASAARSPARRRGGRGTVRDAS